MNVCINTHKHCYTYLDSERTRTILVSLSKFWYNTIVAVLCVRVYIIVSHAIFTLPLDFQQVKIYL